MLCLRRYGAEKGPPPGMEEGAFHRCTHRRMKSRRLTSRIIQHRALARPFFAKDRISDFELFEKHGAPALAILRAHAAAGTPVDAQDLFARFSLDAAAEFLFGERLATLRGALPVAGRARLGTKGSATDDAFGAFVAAFEACQQIVSLRALRGYFWPVREVVRDEMEPHAGVIAAFLEPIVQRTLERRQKMRQAGVASSAQHDTFLEYLADNTEGTPCCLVFVLARLTSLRSQTPRSSRTSSSVSCSPDATQPRVC